MRHAIHPTETDALFALLSERYETRSTLIPSNVPFAQWSTFFKDEMTAAAVIDRLVHHSVILELNTQSYRMTEAKNKLPTDVKNRMAEGQNTGAKNPSAQNAETQNKLPEEANNRTAEDQDNLLENVTNKEEA